MGSVLTAMSSQGALGAWPAIAWPGTRELEVAQQRKASLQESWFADEVSNSSYFSRLMREETEIKQLFNEQQAWLLRHRPATHATGDARTRWEGLSMSGKRAVLFGLLDSVFILPGTKGSHRFDPTTVIPVWQTTVPAVLAE